MKSEPSDYETLIRPIQDRMFRLIWRITGVVEDTEDALQESLAVIWKRKAEIERHPCSQAFMLRICVNCATDALRKRLRRGLRETPLAKPNEVHSKDYPVDESLSNKELRTTISQALVQLPSQQATAILMRYFLDLSYDEIGAAMNCSPATARVHVNRACKKLSKLLAKLSPPLYKEKSR